MTSFIERETVSDVDLIRETRVGDEAAVEELYRRHRESALRFARSLTDPVTAEDVVAEAFLKVLETIRAGGGPEVSFRPYLLTAVRNTYVSHVRRDARHVWVDDHERGLDRPTDADVADERHESSLLAAAFAALPERWQTVLWHSTVEGEDHVTIGRRLGLKPNAVAALGFRARDGLRRAYLDAHLGSADEHCRPYRERLAPYVRGQLRNQQREEVQRHLDECPSCTAGFLELSAINTNLGAVLAPALLGGTATGYAVLTAGGSGGLLGGGGSVRSWIRANRTAAATGAAVAATVVATAASFALVSVLGTSEPGAGAGSSAAGASLSPAAPSGSSGPAADEPTDRASTGGRPRVPALPAVATTPAPASTAPSPSVPPPAPSSEGRSDIVTGPGDEKPAGTPSYAPTPEAGQPSPSETTPPSAGPEPTHHDLALTGKSWFWNGPHHHLQMTVTGAADTTTLTVRVHDLESFVVHGETQYVPGTCTTSGTDGDLTTLTCLLGPVSGSFAIDLVVTGGQGALDATVRVSATDNLDPDPANDELHYTG